MSVSITRVLCGLVSENAYIVSADGRDDCFVVDPGDDHAALSRALGERTVRAILLTHGHFDHIMAAGSLSEATGAPVWVGAEDEEMLNDAALNGYGLLMGENRACWPTITARPYEGLLSLCGMEVEVLPTPGHSRGSVCLYLRDEGVLFSGDTLFQAGYGRLDLYGGDMNAMIASLKALFALPGNVRVYPGHGGETTIGAEKARYRL